MFALFAFALCDCGCATMPMDSPMHGLDQYQDPKVHVFALDVAKRSSVTQTLPTGPRRIVASNQTTAYASCLIMGKKSDIQPEYSERDRQPVLW